MEEYALGSTFYIDFTTRAFASGVPTTLAGTPALSVLEQNNATPITSGVSVSVDRASVAGLHMATIVATTANGYEAGKTYSLYVSTGTVDSVSSVGEVVGRFRIESASTQAARQLREALYPNATLGTQTGVSDGTAINLTGIVDADDTANQLVNEVLAVQDDGTGQVVLVKVTAYALTNQLATVETLYGGAAMPFTAASGDRCWRIGHTSANVQQVSGTDVTWSATRGLAGTALPDAAADEAGGLPISDAGGLDLDALVFTNKAALDAFAATIITGTTSGTPTATTASFTGLSHTVTTNELRGRTAIFADGTGGSQAGRITANTSSAITYTTLTTAPATSLAFVIV